MAISTIIYDGTDFTTLDFLKTSVQTTANWTSSETPFDGADGGIFSQNVLKSMSINVAGVAPKANDDAIKIALASRDLASLQITGFADRYWNAKLAGSVDSERGHSFSHYNLSFITDGAAYASSETATPVPDNSDTVVANSGSSYSYPVIVVSGLGATSVVTIENKTTSQTVVFDNTGLSFSTVTLDTTPGASRVYSGSSSGMTGVSDDSWVPQHLDVGNNTYNIATTGGSTPSAVVTFRKRYT